MNKLIATILVLAAALVTPLRAQVSTNPNNTIVRFDIQTEGTNFGTLDIELFDEEKPETVRNFLLYLHYGVYSDLVIHRAVSNFVVQAGTVRVRNPNSTDGFSSYQQSPNLGQITNEYGVGPELKNVFGTIAMARIEGMTNSASADWFINLNDNTDLDTRDGGFTVFGRIINTSGPKTGTNVLNHFRSLTNITSAITFNPFNFFFELPFMPRWMTGTNYTYTTNGNVITTNVIVAPVIAPLQVRDLFTVNASIIRGKRERVRPKLTVQQPERSLKVTTEPALTLTGTASDKSSGIARVMVLSSGLEMANGHENWSHDFTLKPGTNIIQIASLDWLGNQSRVQVRKIFYQVPTPITIAVSGPGVISGLTNQQILDIGRNYRIKAKPEKGNFFVGWRGSLVSPNADLTFSMAEGLQLTAVFSTNHFPRLKGTYQGLITTVSGAARTAGAISLRLNANGSYTGRLQPLNVSYPIRGKFHFTHTSIIYGSRNGEILTLGMQLHTNGVPRIEGFYTDGDQGANILMYRTEADDVSGIPEGAYTFAVDPQTNSVFGNGFSVGTASVDAAGNVTISGTLQDGTAIDHTSRLQGGNNFPMFLKWSPQEAILGWMSFDTNNAGFSGTLQWVTDRSTNRFENGKVIGSRFVPPEPGSPPLGWAQGTATLSGEDLAEPISVGVTFDGNVLQTAPNSVELMFDSVTADGRVVGSFIHPSTQAITPVQGVLLQNSNSATGYFRGVNRSGAMRIQQ